MIIDCIADLHGHYPQLEGGDLLIIAGDLTGEDSQEEVDDFDEWLANQRYKKKIFITGNHDNLLIREKPKKYMLKIGKKEFERHEYLCDSGTEFEGLKIWGSPWTMKLKGMNPDCVAFTVDTEKQLAEKWALIPDDIDILVTHTPMFSYLDKTMDGPWVGSASLRLWSKKNYLKGGRIKLHICGHIHEGYGICEDAVIPIRVNASHVNERYEPVNKPIRVVL